MFVTSRSPSIALARNQLACSRGMRSDPPSRGARLRPANRKARLEGPIEFPAPTGYVFSGVVPFHLSGVLGLTRYSEGRKARGLRYKFPLRRRVEPPRDSRSRRSQDWPRRSLRLPQDRRPTGQPNLVPPLAPGWPARHHRVSLFSPETPVTVRPLTQRWDLHDFIPRLGGENQKRPSPVERPVPSELRRGRRRGRP